MGSTTLRTERGLVTGELVGTFIRDGVKYVTVRDKTGFYHVYPELRVTTTDENNEIFVEADL